MSVTPEQSDILRQKLDNAYRLINQVSGTGIVPYLNQIKIDSRPEPRLFREISDPWQWSLVKETGLSGALENLTHVNQEYTGPRYFWFTMPRGHDKTGLLGRLANWCLAYSKTNLEAIAAAVDREQASFLLDSMQVEARLNPWLSRNLYFKHNEVKGQPYTRLRILAADAKSTYGAKADLLICDELTQWPRRDMWDALVSGRDKRRGSVMIVITNAGIRGTWQHEALEVAKKSRFWRVYEAPGPICTWQSEEERNEARQLLIPQIARRVYDNEWLDPGEGCGYITRAEAQACEDFGSSLGLLPRSRGRVGINYVAGIDYGISRDRTVMVVMHQENDRFLVDRMDVMQGSKKKHVPVEQVEDWIREVKEVFDLQALVIDKFQMESTCQKFENSLNVVRFEPRGGKANFEWAQALRSAVLNLKLAWPPGLGMVIYKGHSHSLVDEFSEVTTKEMSYGYKVQNSYGTHDDRVTAIGMCLLHLSQTQRKRDLLVEGAWW